jgi:hypothetical protein
MKKHILAALVAAASVAGAHAQTSVVNYSTGGTNVPGYTGFFNNANGWTVATNNDYWEGQQGWVGTFSAVDSVSSVAGLTPGSPDGNGSGTLGLTNFRPLLPLNTATPYIERTFSPGLSSVSGSFTNIATRFVAEWAVLEQGPTPWDDSFTFDLRNAANTISLLTFTLGQTFAPGPGADYTIASTGSAPLNQFEASYGALLRMQVDITSTGSYSGSWALLDPVNRTNTASGVINTGSLAGGAVAADVGALRFGWQLASGDANDPGTLGTVVNQFTFTSTGDPIPEPSTWALLFLAGLLAAIGFRRSARARKEH